MFSVVYTAGTWDLFHIGHLRILQRCASYGKHLVVGVSTDKLVQEYKGLKPFTAYEERFEIISALRCVDVVVPQERLLDPEDMITHSMDVLILGDDWKDSKVQGIKWARQHRSVLFLPRTPNISTTIIKKRLSDGGIGL